MYLIQVTCCHWLVIILLITVTPHVIYYSLLPSSVLLYYGFLDTILDDAMHVTD